MTQLHEKPQQSNTSHESINGADKLAAILNDPQAASTPEGGDAFTAIDKEYAMRKQEIMHQQAMDSINQIYDGALDNFNRIQDDYVQQRDAILQGGEGAVASTSEKAVEVPDAVQAANPVAPAHVVEAPREGGRHRAAELVDTDDADVRPGRLPAVPAGTRRMNSGALVAVPKSERQAAPRPAPEEDDAVRILGRTLPSVPVSTSRIRTAEPAVAEQDDVRSTRGFIPPVPQSRPATATRTGVSTPRVPQTRRAPAPAPDKEKRAVFGGPWAYEPEPGSAEAQAMSRWGRAALIQGENGAIVTDQRENVDRFPRVREASNSIGRLLVKGVHHLGRGAVAAGNALASGYADSIVQPAQERQPQRPAEAHHVPVEDQSADQTVRVLVPPQQRPQGMDLDAVVTHVAQNSRR